MVKYSVILQSGHTGVTKEVEFVCQWDPEKVNTEEVARACAAQHTVAGGHNPDATFKHPFMGISAILQPAEVTA